MREDGPRATVVALRVDGDNEALAAEGVGGFVDDVRRFNSGSVDADLIGTGQKHLAHVSDGANAATDGQWHETARCGARDDIDNCFALLMARGDVEEDEFIGSLRVINHRALHGITRIAKLKEFRAFDDTTFLNVETGDDALGEHGNEDGRKREKKKKIRTG